MIFLASLRGGCETRSASFGLLLGKPFASLRDQLLSIPLLYRRALTDLVKLVQRLDDRVTELILAIFQKINGLLRHTENRIKETTAVTVSLIGK